MTGRRHPVRSHAHGRTQAAPARILLLLALLAAGACKETAGPGGSFSITPATAALLVGEGIQLSAVGAPGEVAWSSSNSSVASVIPETGYTTGAGRGEALVTAVSGSSAASATITVTVPPSLRLSRPTVEFETGVGEADPPAETVLADNAGDASINSVAAGAIQYAQGQLTGWLEVTPTGSSPAPVTFTLQSHTQSLPAGTYNASVPIFASDVANSPQNIAVTLRVLAPPSIVLSRSSVPMAGIPGTTIQETVDVTNGGDRALTGLSATVTYAGATQGWLQPTLGGTAPTTLTLMANTTGLAVGSHQAVVHVASGLTGVEAKDISVELTVSPGPAIQLSRSGVTVNATNGTSPPSETVAITNGGGGSLTGLSVGTVGYGAGQPGNWLTASLDATQAPATLTLAVSSAGLAQGTYNATVPIVSAVASNSPINLPVTLIVGPPPSLTLLPGSVLFSTFQGASILPGAQGVAVTNSGGGTIAGLSYTIQYQSGTNWLAATWQNGVMTAPATLLVNPTSAALAEGTYHATVTIASTTPGVSAKTFAVTYAVQSFTTRVIPTLQSAFSGYTRTPCTSCHFSGGQPPFFDTSPSTLWTTLQGYITPGDANAGTLVCKITGNAGSTPCGTFYMPMPPAWVATVQAWIRAGAPYQ
jgi:hypothetical protein